MTSHIAFTTLILVYSAVLSAYVYTYVALHIRRCLRCLQSITDYLQSISDLYALSFFGQISHGTILVALSLTFLNLLKSCDLVLFSWRKMPKKKIWHFSKSFTSYLHKGSTLEHDLNRFWKLQFSATTFVLFGNAHWTLKTVPSQHHHQSIPDFF